MLVHFFFFFTPDHTDLFIYLFICIFIYFRMLFVYYFMYLFIYFNVSSPSRVFCSTHRAAHKCSVDVTAINKVPQCPLCTQFIRFSVDVAPDTLMDQHIKSGCLEHTMESHKHGKSCGYKGCRKPSGPIPFVCDACRLKFCSSHRSGLDHECAGRPQVQ